MMTQLYKKSYIFILFCIIYTQKISSQHQAAKQVIQQVGLKTLQLAKAHPFQAIQATLIAAAILKVLQKTVCLLQEYMAQYLQH